MTTAICVLRSGGEYKPEHARRLYVDTVKHWPIDSVQQMRFVLLTDMEVPPWPGIEVRPLTRPKLCGWWSKIELFAPEHLDLGNILYFDLDTMIVGDLADIVSQAAFDVTLLSDFYRPHLLQSGMMGFRASARSATWEAWVSQRGSVRKRGDGEWLHEVWQDYAERWQDVLPGQVVSYKVHCKQTGVVPAGARVVCFHGRPRPWAVSTFWNREVLRGGASRRSHEP